MTQVSWEEFGDMLSSFKTSALRLEVRERYNTDADLEARRQFLAGEEVDLEWLGSWLDQVRHITAAGKVFRRARVVSVPLSDYNRYAIWCAHHQTIPAGEDIRYLERSEAGDLPDLDYWLLDGDKALVLYFDIDDRPTTAEVVTDVTRVRELADAVDSALRRAHQVTVFADRHGIEL